MDGYKSVGLLKANGEGGYEIMIDEKYVEMAKSLASALVGGSGPSDSSDQTVEHEDGLEPYAP